MPGLELVVGYLVGWFLKKSRHVGTRADQEVDRVLDRGMDRVHDLVSRKLGDEPALAQLADEAAREVDNPRTRQRVLLALEEATERDSEFAARLGAVLTELRGAAGDPAVVRQTAIAENNSTVVQAGRDITGTWPDRR